MMKFNPEEISIELRRIEKMTENQKYTTGELKLHDMVKDCAGCIEDMTAILKAVEDRCKKFDPPNSALHYYGAGDLAYEILNIIGGNE